MRTDHHALRQRDRVQHTTRGIGFYAVYASLRLEWVTGARDEVAVAAVGASDAGQDRSQREDATVTRARCEVQWRVRSSHNATNKRSLGRALLRESGWWGK